MSTRCIAARLSLLTSVLIAFTTAVGDARQEARDDPPTEERRLVVEPARLELDAGDTAQLSAHVEGAEG